ncbi:MAG: CoA pyrophosphatase, partial [Gammaproteobacteria bacterium]|nr:CoA pyrophosphatase [Gammaproteobacteria bacterium]
MKQRIERRLSHSTPPVDPVSSALGALPDQVAAQWFVRPLIPAAVLVPILEQGDSLSVLLTQRTENLTDHPGQISFPGGRSEAHDAGPLETALREAQEEIGLSGDCVNVAGYLSTLAVISGFAVTPVVGFVSGQNEFQPDSYEVEALFEVPLAYFLNEENTV